MLRTSSYTIYVDLPDTRSEMLLVHGYTGAWDKVSRRVAEFLRAKESRRAPKPLYGTWSEAEAPRISKDVRAPPDELLARLEKRGYLTHLSPEDETTVFARLAEKLHERASRQAPTYVFMPTYNCNLRCPYCFQDHMRTDSRYRHLLRTMTPEMVDRLFAAIPDIESRHGVDGNMPGRRGVGLFGGEPLLAAQRPIVERIVGAAKELEADVWAVTNGTELAAYRDLLGPDKIARLQITLDGPPAEHDRRRVYPDGSGSFARIAENVTLALELGTRISIRLNVDRANLGDLPAVAREIVDQGWHRQPGFSAYSAPINAVNDKTERQTTMNSWELDRALGELYDEHPETRVIARPDEAIRARARRVFAGEEVLPQMRPSFCGAHDKMYIFDPFGDVYACWEKTGDEKVRIARITDDCRIVFEHELNHEWRSRSVASNPVCRRCRYALHCGGGCAVLALGQRGKMHANYCDGFASRFRGGVAEAYGDHQAGTEIVAVAEPPCDL